MNVHAPSHKIMIGTVIKVVCASYGVSEIEILSARRPARTVEARHVAMWLSTVLTPRSSSDIGRRFGGKDHTTILHGARKVQRRVEADPEFEEHVLALRYAVIAAHQCGGRLGLPDTPDPTLEDVAGRILTRGPTAASSVEIVRLACAYMADREEDTDAPEPGDPMRLLPAEQAADRIVTVETIVEKPVEVVKYPEHVRQAIEAAWRFVTANDQVAMAAADPESLKEARRRQVSAYRTLRDRLRTCDAQELETQETEDGH